MAAGLLVVGVTLAGRSLPHSLPSRARAPCAAKVSCMLGWDSSLAAVFAPRSHPRLPLAFANPYRSTSSSFFFFSFFHRLLLVSFSSLLLLQAKHCYLAVFVLMDMLNKDSFFRPYYDILPMEYPNMPIFWGEDQLKYLEGSYMLTQLSERKVSNAPHSPCNSTV